MATDKHDPINNVDDDKLRRSDMAKNIATDIQSIDTSEGYVIAVIGPWGSGKTSLINLIKSHLKINESAIEALDFNPWMFSGADQLVHAFFSEMAAQLRMKRGRFEKIADDFATYGDLLSPLSAIPFLGAWLDRVRGAGKAFKQFKDARKESVNARRDSLAEKLSKLDKPILVVIDDIDRLNTGEIRDMFKLVRLTASFPNLVYVLAFDRQRVEEALAEQGVNGRSFLEKIVQYPIDIPIVADQVMYREIARELDNALTTLSNDASLNTNRWHDIFPEIIRPLIRNIRDARRYADAVRGTARGLIGRVELADLLALEAIRVFMPDTFHAVAESQAALSSPAPPIGSRDSADADNKAAIEALLESAGAHRHVANSLIGRIFPAAGRHIGGAHYAADWQKSWLRERRLAHPDILRLYLERTTNDRVAAFDDAELAFSILDDLSNLDAFLRSIDTSRQTAVIEALETYEGHYPTSAIVPASVVLLNMLPDLPETESPNILSMGTRLIVTRVVLRLLRQLDSPEEVGSAVAEIWPQLRSLYARLSLTQLIGSIEGAGHRLVDEQVGLDYEEQLEEQISAATAERLAQEKEIFRLLYWKQRRDDARPLILADDMVDNVPFVRTLLLESVHERRSQAIGNRTVYKQKEMYWNSLLAFFGDELRLSSALEKVRTAYDDGRTGEALDLADRYLDGWRPESF